MYLIITSSACKYCKESIKLLEEKGLNYIAINIDDIGAFSLEARQSIVNNLKDNGLKTVPQIFKLIGDSEMLKKTLESNA